MKNISCGQMWSLLALLTFHVMPINLLDFYSKLGQYCHTCMTIQYCNYCNSIIITNRYY